MIRFVWLIFYRQFWMKSAVQRVLHLIVIFNPLVTLITWRLNHHKYSSRYSYVFVTFPLDSCNRRFSRCQKWTCPWPKFSSLHVHRKILPVQNGRPSVQSIVQWNVTSAIAADVRVGAVHFQNTPQLQYRGPEVYKLFHQRSVLFFHCNL